MSNGSIPAMVEEGVKALQPLKTVGTSLWAIWPRVKQWIVYRASGVPRQPLTFAPDQWRPATWVTHIVEPIYRMALTCNWVVTNTSDRHVSITTVRLDSPRVPGVAQLFAVREACMIPPGDVVRVPALFLEPGQIGHVECNFWILPPLFKPPAPLKTTVIFGDNFGNEYCIKDAVSRHEFPVCDSYMKEYFPI